MHLPEIFANTLKQGASDLHLSTGLPPILRIDGELTVMDHITALDENTIKNFIYLMIDKKQQEQFEAQLEIDFIYLLEKTARFRAHVFQQARGIAATFRIIPNLIPTLEHLGLPTILKTLFNVPNGLILVTGPTGSGKTTTLAAMLNEINTQQSRHIVTIEDPIEFMHQSKKSLIHQRQVHRDTHDFTSALRATLREDPDIILIGEMRDLETIRLALTAAETGHLVLASLHTSTAPRAINRMIDVFPAGEKNIIRNMLSESLQAIICQTLLKKIAGGRVAAVEIMIGSPAIRHLIREDKIAQMYTSIQTGGEKGMHTLDQYLQTLVTNKIISSTTARTVAVNKDSFSF